MIKESAQLWVHRRLPPLVVPRNRTVVNGAPVRPLLRQDAGKTQGPAAIAAGRSQQVHRLPERLLVAGVAHRRLASEAVTAIRQQVQRTLQRQRPIVVLDRALDALGIGGRQLDDEIAQIQGAGQVARVQRKETTPSAVAGRRRSGINPVD